MSQNIYFSKSISLSDVRKCHKLVISEQKRLYGNLDNATYLITHEDFPDEGAYIIFDEYKDDSKNAYYGKDCESCTFCEIENHFGPLYHILLILAGTFDLEYAYDIEAWSEGKFMEYSLNLKREDSDIPIPMYISENSNIITEEEEELTEQDELINQMCDLIDPEHKAKCEELFT